MSFPIKIAFNGELRRFMSPSAPSYVDVVAAVQQMFPRLSANGFSLKYEDEENELITIASEAELAEALAVCEHLERKTLKLIVFSREEDWVSVPQLVEERALDERKEVENKPEPENQQEPEPEKEPQSQPLNQPEPDKKEPEAEKEKEEPLPTKDEIVAVLVELVSDERVQAELPKLVETALSDVSLDALLDPSLPIVELLRNILSSVPEIAAHPSAGRLLAAAAHTKAGEAMSQIREQLATTFVPFLRSLRPMLLTTLPLLIQQLPAMIQSLVDKVSSACQSGEASSGMPCFMDAFPFLAPFAASFGMPECGNQAADEAEEAPSAGARAEEEPVHRGVTCDSCGASPIVGVRFKCTVCPNFDLCKACEAKGEHAPSHPLLQLRATAGETVHENIQCNTCGVVPIHGPRFKCTVCPNFDLCDACEQKGQHPHPMLKLRQAENRPHGRGRHWHRGHLPTDLTDPVIGTISRVMKTRLAPNGAAFLGLERFKVLVLLVLLPLATCLVVQTHLVQAVARYSFPT